MTEPAQPKISIGFYNLMGSLAHVFFGAWITLACVYMFGPKSLYWTLPLLVTYAAIKEFWWDENYETADERWNGFYDFGTYISGGILTLIMVWIRVKMGKSG